MGVPQYRLGFAVKILGRGGLATADTRRWQSGPHLSRSLELLERAFDYLDANDLRVFRLSSGTVPYGTHPYLPELDYRRQIEGCAQELALLGAKARGYGLRLSTHPGQYTVLNAEDEDVRRKALLDVEQDALLLDALGQGPDAVVVVHVGGRYADRARALDRWEQSFGQLSEQARRRIAVEHDERSFDLADALELHARTGARVIFDLHHHRCNPAPAFGELAGAVAAACRTWPVGVRPKVHLSSPRTELRETGRGREVRLVAPLLDQHADFATPWDLLELLRAAPGSLDVMVEAKAKDLAVLWLRRQLERVAPAAAAREASRREEGSSTRSTRTSGQAPAGRATGRRRGASPPPARTRAGS
ncbi:MAG: UV DNA damage repair endonuclease UvsE [Actinomycetota bacterium]|nr:UV DNA damage repair endonuclease UvsE [Actinomycetota bacterium]